MDLEVLWKQRQTKGNPSGGLPPCEAILVANSGVVEAQPLGQRERVDMQDAVVPALLRVKC